MANSTLRIQRYNYRSRSALTCGCLGLLAGCALAFTVGLVILIPALPAIGARLMGFSPAGRTDDVFVEASPIAPPQLEDPMPVSQIVVDLGSYGAHTLSGSTSAYQVSVAGDQQAATARFSESGLTELCVQMSDLCENNGGPYQNARFDLRPGGAVIYADLNVGGLWQTAGVVLRLDGTAPRFEVVGVDIGGVLYAAPPEGLGATIGEVERVGNDVLNQLIVQAGGSSFAASEVYVDDTSLTLVLR